jgi:hypothetical protein
MPVKLKIRCLFQDDVVTIEYVSIKGSDNTYILRILMYHGVT